MTSYTKTPCISTGSLAKNVIWGNRPFGQSDCRESNPVRGALRCFTVKLHSEIRPPALQSRRPIHFWRIVDGFFHRIPCYHNITKAGRFCPHFLKDPENDKKGAGIHKILSSRLVSFQAVHHIRQNHKTAHLSRF